MTRLWLWLKAAVVVITFALCITAVLVRPSARPVVQPKAQELYQVVTQQLVAVREADYTRAYRQVSLSMQERYNIEDFADFVRLEHPDLARFERIEFGEITARGRHAILPAYLFLRTGEIALVHYTLIREEGRWKIDGSRLTRRWSRAHRVAGERI